MRRPRQSEASVERAIVHLYTLAGCTVYRLSQGYRPEPGGTRQTPGMADLRVFAPALSSYWEHEVKNHEGFLEHLRYSNTDRPHIPSKLRKWKYVQGQIAYRDICTACGIVCLIGGQDAAEAHLILLGLDQIGLLPSDRRIGRPKRG